MKNLMETIRWHMLLKLLPSGWQEASVACGALRRRRTITDAETLLRLILLHAASGASLRTTVVHARHAQLCTISDVALLHRLRAAERWLGWLVQQLSAGLGTRHAAPRLRGRFRVRLIDSTVVSEPGSTGSDWRLHYSVLLESLRCDHVVITDVHTAESLCHYPVEPDDVLVADRGYCRRRDISYVVQQGGQVILRYHWNSLPLLTRTGQRWNSLEALEGLAPGAIGDWDVWVQQPGADTLIKGRLVAIRKEGVAWQRACEQARRTAARHGHRLQPLTLQYAQYVMVFTTFSRHWLTPRAVLNIYRDRWQVELVFKRLKGLVRVGMVPKTDATSCRAWLHAKLVLALLAERLRREAELFSPWGFPLDAEPHDTQSVA